MVTFVLVATVVVVTVNVFELVCAAMVTVGGTVATAVFRLVVVTTAPPVGALPVRVKVAVEGLPPTTLVGLRVKVESAALVTAGPGQGYLLYEGIGHTACALGTGTSNREKEGARCGDSVRWSHRISNTAGSRG